MLTYALRICKCPQIPEFNPENFITTTYGGRSIYSLSGHGKGVRALAQHPTSAYIIQDWNMYLAPFV